MTTLTAAMGFFTGVCLGALFVALAMRTMGGKVYWSLLWLSVRDVSFIGGCAFVAWWLTS